MPRIKKPKGTIEVSTSLVLDWKGYFDEFCSVHGDPIECGGRVLFPDGWTYSLSSYEGPEFSPPTDPDALRELQAAYWQKRHDMQYQQFIDLREFVLKLQKMQQLKSLPVKHRVGITDKDEYGNTVRSVESRVVSVDPYKLKLRELRSDLKNCKEHLTRLGVPSNEQAKEYVNHQTAQDSQ